MAPAGASAARSPAGHLIVTEGLVTEPGYFNALKADRRFTSVHVVVNPAPGDPLQVVHAAVRERREQAVRARRRRDEPFSGDVEYEQVWAVFDREGIHEAPSFRAAIALAHEQGIRHAVSNPAFEVWLLLHLVDGLGPLDSGHAAKRRLAKELGTDAGDVYRHLKPGIPAAVERARRLRHVDFDDPSTGCGELVDLLLNRA